MSTGARVSVGGPADRWRSLLAARSVRYAAGVVLIAAGYYAAAQGGEALLLTGPAGAFWPATGVGIAVLYLGGLRWWPGVLLGDLLSREFTELPLGTALAETAGNTAGPSSRCSSSDVWPAAAPRWTGSSTSARCSSPSRSARASARRSRCSRCGRAT